MLRRSKRLLGAPLSTLLPLLLSVEVLEAPLPARDSTPGGCTDISSSFIAIVGEPSIDPGICAWGLAQLVGVGSEQDHRN